MDNNLIPTFILREVGVNVHDTPKKHFPDLESRDHAIKFPDSDLLIPLSLWGIFSFFHAIIPTSYDIQHKPHLFLMPGSIYWKHYSEYYDTYEDSMLDWERNTKERKYCKKHIIDAPESLPISESYFEERIDMATAGASNTNALDSFHSMLHNDAEASKPFTDRLEPSMFEI